MLPGQVRLNISASDPASAGILFLVKIRLSLVGLAVPQKIPDFVPLRNFVYGVAVSGYNFTGREEESYETVR